MVYTLRHLAPEGTQVVMIRALAPRSTVYQIRQLSSLPLGETHGPGNIDRI